MSNCFENTYPFGLDNVLVAVAYYIGAEKEVDGALPFSILGFFTTPCLICSEIIARTRKRKISPTGVKSNQNRSRNLVISNLIPFTKLNIIFAFGCLIMALVKAIEVIYKTQYSEQYWENLVMLMICRINIQGVSKKSPE